MLLLIQQLDYLKRQLFGRKSEGWGHPYSFTPDTSGELGKPGHSGDTDAPEDDTQAATATSKEPTHRREIRNDRPPANVPVITEEILPAVVEADSDSWRPAGSEESWQLQKKPGYFYLRVIKRLKFVRRDEPFSPPVIEPAMPSLIHGGFWGSGLLAELLTNTYLDHLPFYRQRVLYLQRHGVDLSESTISAATDKVVNQLGLLLSSIKDDMLAGGLARAYEAFICFLDRTHLGGSSREIVIRLVGSLNKITKLSGFSKIVKCRCEASPNDDFTMQKFEANFANFYPNRAKIRWLVMMLGSMSRVTQSFFLQREARPSSVNQTAARESIFTGLPRLYFGDYSGFFKKLITRSPFSEIMRPSWARIDPFSSISLFLRLWPGHQLFQRHSTQSELGGVNFLAASHPHLSAGYDQPVAPNSDSVTPVKFSAPGFAKQEEARQKEAFGATLPIRLVLVEDDPRLLSILADALGTHSDFEVLSCHGSAEEALATADWEHCTILLADLSLPRLGGVELIRRAKASRPGLIAAAYTVNDQQQEVLAAIRAGASGYILKRESLERLVEAITELATGGAPITPSVASMILDVLRNEGPETAAPRLSPREQKVLRLVADGYMQKEIASLLSVSLYTVQSHTKRIYKKLEAKGRLEAIAKARLSGLL